jgi:hypothetical protein
MLGHRHRLGPGKVGQPAEAVLGVSRRPGIHPIPVLIQASCDQYGKIWQQLAGSPGGNPEKSAAGRRCAASFAASIYFCRERDPRGPLAK